MSRFAIVAALALLGGCATTRTPAIEVRTQEVRVPVPVQCINPSNVPAEPPRVGDRLNGQAAHDADVLGGSALLLRQWGRELRALITPCMRD